MDRFLVYLKALRPFPVISTVIRNEMPRTRHDIERLIERSSIDGAGGVPMGVRRSAFAAVATHPNFERALSHPLCHAVVMVEPKTFLDRSHWPDETTPTIAAQLRDTSTVVLLSFMTSDIERNEHFTGGGVTYDYVLHPDTYTILYHALGSWRT